MLVWFCPRSQSGCFGLAACTPEGKCSGDPFFLPTEKQKCSEVKSDRELPLVLWRLSKVSPRGYLLSTCFVKWTSSLYVHKKWSPSRPGADGIRCVHPVCVHGWSCILLVQTAQCFVCMLKDLFWLQCLTLCENTFFYFRYKLPLIDTSPNAFNRPRLVEPQLITQLSASLQVMGWRGGGGVLCLLLVFRKKCLVSS